MLLVILSLLTCNFIFLLTEKKGFKFHIKNEYSTVLLQPQHMILQIINIDPPVFAKCSMLAIYNKGLLLD